MKKHFITIIALGMLLSNSIDAQEAGRIPFNKNWKFQKGDPTGIDSSLNYSRIKPWILPTGNALLFTQKPATRPEGRINGGEYTTDTFDDTAWRTLDLPHDWGIEGPFKYEYPGETGKLPWWGVAWYRKNFEVEKSDKGKQFYLDIDGAMSFSTVWCNGELVGGWPYGYTSYRVDLTPYIKAGKKNTLAIRIDNPNESSRWYPGGGIYRNVWLIKENPVSIAQWGTYLTTPQVSKDEATIDLQLTLQNRNNSQKPLTVTTQVYEQDSKGNPTGHMLCKAETQLPGIQDGQTVLQKMLLNQPKLWDVTSPNLYIAVTTLSQDGKEVSQYNTPFGIRTILFTSNDGFHLNGRKLPIRGVCMHHDLGALGAAINERALERQLTILKDMGVNAIRTSHNPPAPELLTLCDRMGFLVMDELTDTWTMPKKKNGYAMLYEDWYEQDLTALIRRDRNHPSIILWSTGNEIGEQGKPEKFYVSQQLTDIAHREDPTRLTTFGSNHPVASNNGFQLTGDAFGFNYKPHLYGEFHRNHPSIPVYGSETASCISTRGEYAFPVSNNKKDGKVGFQMSSYDLYAPSWATPPDWEFEGQDKNPASAGEFVWTGFDYLGEPTPFNSDLTVLGNFNDPEERARAEKELAEIGKIRVPSRSSYFGIVDLAGFPKDRYYIYQARWRPELPMAHILPHWNWPERVNEITPVHIYTSGDSAELFINGISQGTKKKGEYEYRLRWDSVRYQPGTVKVIAYKNGIEWASDSIVTSGTATTMQLQSDRSNVQADGEDLVFVTVRIVDENGNFVPRAQNLIRFSVEGPARIVATDNGDPTSHESFQNPYIKAFNGLALVILRSTGENGPIRLKASSEGLPTQEIKLQAQK